MSRTQTKLLHEPSLRTVMMVEKGILEAEEYPTRMELWKSLPKGVQYQTFKRVLDYLEASGKIVFDDGKIIYTGVNNARLRSLLKSSVVSR